MKKIVYKLVAKSSKIDGKGLFAREVIPGKKKIGELTGEIITVAKARKLAKQIKRIAIVELDEKYAMDASRDENKFKYINHSCKPNTYMRVINRRVEFYSLREIFIHEELTCNYGETHHDGLLKCNCGSAECKRYL